MARIRTPPRGVRCPGDASAESTLSQNGHGKHSKRFLFLQAQRQKSQPHVQLSLVNRGATKVRVRPGDLHNTAVSSRFRQACETVRVHRILGGEADLGQSQFVLETKVAFLLVVQVTRFLQLLHHHRRPYSMAYHAAFLMRSLPSILVVEITSHTFIRSTQYPPAVVKRLFSIMLYRSTGVIHIPLRSTLRTRQEERRTYTHTHTHTHTQNRPRNRLYPKEGVFLGSAVVERGVLFFRGVSPRY